MGASQTPVRCSLLGAVEEERSTFSKSLLPSTARQLFKRGLAFLFPTLPSAGSESFFFSCISKSSSWLTNWLQSWSEPGELQFGKRIPHPQEEEVVFTLTHTHTVVWKKKNIPSHSIELYSVDRFNWIHWWKKVESSIWKKKTNWRTIMLILWRCPNCQRSDYCWRKKNNNNYKTFRRRKEISRSLNRWQVSRSVFIPIFQSSAYSTFHSWNWKKRKKEKNRGRMNCRVICTWWSGQTLACFVSVPVSDIESGLGSSLPNLGRDDERMMP